MMSSSGLKWSSYRACFRALFLLQDVFKEREGVHKLSNVLLLSYWHFIVKVADLQEG